MSDRDSVCPAILTTSIGALADLIDGIGTTVLTAVLNFVVGVISCIVYFFTGQFDKFVSAFLTQVLGSIAGFFSNLGALIFQFLKSLPIVGDLINILFNIIRGACSILNKAIKFFGGDDIGCDSIGKRKRAAAGGAGTWFAGVRANVTDVWQAGGAAAGACSYAARLAPLVTTPFDALTGAQHDELLFCLVAHLWVGPVADADILDPADRAPVSSGAACDQLMPALYAGARAWPDLLPVERMLALPCAEARLQAEMLRADPVSPAPWLPRDLFFAGATGPRVVQLLDQTWTAYDVWAQMTADRLTSGATLRSAAYAASWAAKGASTAHLAAAVRAADAAGGESDAALEARIQRLDRKSGG